ncbi:MAG TPA: cytochrome c biogenesis protein ResB, partial [Rectinemataceae bacterium]|nr:cytochrome c biogenesis protein ResB [Rectinemataceae bacterium]
SSTSTAADRNSLPAKGVHTVKVNSPLRYKGYTIYQQDWNSETQVQLQDAMGIKVSLEPGKRAQMQGGFVLYMSVEKNPPTMVGAAEYSNYEATFLIDTGGKREVRKARKGETLGLFTFIGFSEKSVSGLKIVQDKGYPFVITGLALVLLGTFITYFRKLRGMIA